MVCLWLKGILVHYGLKLEERYFQLSYNIYIHMLEWKIIITCIQKIREGNDFSHVYHRGSPIEWCTGTRFPGHSPGNLRPPPPPPPSPFRYLIYSIVVFAIALAECFLMGGFVKAQGRRCELNLTSGTTLFSCLRSSELHIDVVSCKRKLIINKAVSMTSTHMTGSANISKKVFAFCIVSFWTLPKTRSFKSVVRVSEFFGVFSLSEYVSG